MPGSAFKFVGDPSPEILLVAQLAIERLMQPGSRVLEFGSGHSTIWFAEMGCVVTSVEHNLDWFESVKDWLAERDLKAKVILRSPETFATVCLDFEDNSLDLVLVDGTHGQYRIDCIRASKNKICPGGWLVLDDSHWKQVKGVPELLEGWVRMDVSGMHLRHTGVLKGAKTSFYRRPIDGSLPGG